MPKRNLFNQPGIERLVADKAGDLYAVKVTGRNMHAVSLVASVSAEAFGVPTSVAATFDKDGSLASVMLIGGYKDPGFAEATVAAGDYLVFDTRNSNVYILSPDAFAELKKLISSVKYLIDYFDRFLVG